MKLASFFLFSLFLHAAALTYPAFFLGSAEKPLIPVVVLSLEEERGDGSIGKGRVGGEEDREAGQKRHAKIQGVEQSSREVEKAPGLENHDSLPVSLPDVNDGVAVASEKTPTPGMVGIPSTLAGVESAGGGESGGWDNSGTGAGSGIGRGEGGKGSRFAQVSYAYSPKPQYPDRARREGWQGTVVLRVLVDEEGKSKLLEVNHSSGFEALDDAAVEIVRRWRFFPARYGERRVESWVKIPIVFRLADFKD